MKQLLLLFFIYLGATACKNEITTTKQAASKNQPSQNEQVKKNYPTSVAAIMEAHGGMTQWNQMNNMCFEMPGRTGVETHTVSLKDRRSKIETKNWSIGYDGTEAWLLQNQPEAYKGNARFYHNLMFYFYAMPFVLADDGITYIKQEPTELEGVLYEGVKVSYADGVGDSSKDEYILYFDSETHQMKWLGYTVTYKDNEKSNRWSYIKYEQWQTVNDLVLPKTLTWYNVEDGKPTEARSSMDFTKVIVTQTVLDDSVFAKPEGAEIAPR